MNSVQSQRARAGQLVSYYMQRMMADSRRSNNHTTEQLLFAIQAFLSSAFVSTQKETPKKIGRRARKLAQRYKRTKLSKRKTAKLHKEFERIDLSQYPHLVKE